METEMRFAISMSSFMNAPNPEGSLLCFGSGFVNTTSPQNRLALRSCSSRNSAFMERGRAANATLIASTTATSSSSDIPASEAASSSSLAIPNETEKARSLPKAPSVVAVSDIASKLLKGSYAWVLPRHVVEAAALESHPLPARLAWQAGFPLVLRRLLVAPRGYKRGSGGTMRKRSRDPSQQEYECAGTIFGGALGNVVHHACGSKHKLFKALRPLRRVLAPAAAALGTMAGADRTHLLRGMCNHRVLRSQGMRMSELKPVPEIDSKYGHVGVAVGISAAVLAVFATMAADPADAAQGLPNQLALCLEQVRTALRSWRFVGSTDDPSVYEALWAEVRAVERAQVGVRRARELGSGTDASKNMELCLNYYRRAAWPAGHIVCVETQEAILKKLRLGELLDVEQPEVVAETGHAGASAPGVVTLAALPDLKPRALGDSGSEGGSASGSASSWNSFASSDTGGSGEEGHPLRDITGLTEGICTKAVLDGRTWYFS